MRISDWSSDVCSSDLAVKDECGKPCLRFGPNRPIQRDGIASPPTAQRKGEVGLVDVPGRDGFLHMVEGGRIRSEEHTSELQSLMRISYAVFCLKKKKHNTHIKDMILRNVARAQ